VAVRTTESAVQGIIEHDSGISLAPFIEAASAVVTKHCTDTGFTATELELIERWLAAHFYAVRDPRSVSEKAGSVSETRQNKVDLGFDVTHYGQMAMRLDWSGALASLNQQAKQGGRVAVSLDWMGTKYEDMDDD